jgi:hypothetical protein
LQNYDQHFWDRKGVLLIDFLLCGKLINADAYCMTLNRLWHAIENRQCSILSSGACLLHDNARQHTAEKITKLLEKFGWENLDLPQYNSAMAPYNFQLFPKMK